MPTSFLVRAAAERLRRNPRAFQSLDLSSDTMRRVPIITLTDGVRTVDVGPHVWASATAPFLGAFVFGDDAAAPACAFTVGFPVIPCRNRGSTRRNNPTLRVLDAAVHAGLEVRGLDDDVPKAETAKLPLTDVRHAIDVFDEGICAAGGHGGAASAFTMEGASTAVHAAPAEMYDALRAKLDGAVARDKLMTEHMRSMFGGGGGGEVMT